jgi:CubicO group peptidase (beta-lactamase class C family)
METWNMNERRRILTGTVPILVLLAGCVADAPYKFPAEPAPQQLPDGWEIAAPEASGVNRSDLDNVYSRLLSEREYFNVKSLLLVKDGKLVFEACVRDPGDRDHYTHIQSVTKSVTSLVFGIVRSDGFFPSLDQTLYSIIPEKFPDDKAKRTITLRHLLTMTSGLLLDNDDFSIELIVEKPADPVRYFLNKPLYANPGDRFYYRDVDPQLVSSALQKVTAKTEEHWARERLFTQLGIRDYHWQSDHTGTTAGAHALHLRPRDMAKIGQMVLDHGRWKGIQIVDSAWIALSTRKQVDVGVQDPPLNYEYGYYWWIHPRRQAISAWGHGGNFIFILPGKNMVLVMTSMPDAGDDAGTSLGEFEELIAPLLN